MRKLLAVLTIVAMSWAFTACNSGSGPASFCDTTCLSDTLKFIKDAHELKPYVYLSANNCNADTLAWSYEGRGANKVSLESMVGAAVKINKNAVTVFFQDTSYAWLLFNDCANGRGYQLKLPYGEGTSIGRKSSGLNAHDPKFDVAEGLLAYSDRGNLFVEDMATGKTAIMTFGQRLEIDYDAVHEYIDSINVTPTKVWARVKIGSDWKEIQKTIELK